MKNIKFIIICVAFLTVSSCTKVVVKDIGFSSPIGRKSTGLSILYINTNAKKVNLYGDIIVNEGKVKVELTNPKGKIEFSKIIESPFNFLVDTNYTAMDGFWKLDYLSNNAKGSIDIHLDYSYN